jgi:hypothetical protein
MEGVRQDADVAAHRPARAARRSATGYLVACIVALLLTLVGAAAPVAFGETGSGAPEFGRCLKVTTGLGTGTYGSASCTSAGGSKNYEWYPAFGSSKPLLKTHFTLANKAGFGVFLTGVKEGGSCLGETGSGEYTSNKAIGNVTLRFTECYCFPSELPEGEVVSTKLTGELGVIKTNAEAVKDLIGIDLKPESGEVFATRSCPGSSETVTYKGSVIGQAVTHVMTTKNTIKYTTSTKAKQIPRSFEGGPIDELTREESGGERFSVGLRATTILTNEEKIEISPVA